MCRSSGDPVKGPFSFNLDMFVNKLTISLYKTDACSCTTVLWSLGTQETRRKLDRISFRKDFWDFSKGGTVV